MRYLHNQMMKMRVFPGNIPAECWPNDNPEYRLEPQDTRYGELVRETHLAVLMEQDEYHMQEHQETQSMAQG